MGHEKDHTHKQYCLESLNSDGGMPNGGLSSFLYMRQNSNLAPPEDLVTLIPRAGKIKSLFAYLDTAPGAGETVRVKVRVNKADPGTQLTCDIDDTDQSSNDTSNEMTVAQGDRISVGVSGTAGNSATDMSVSLEIEYESENPT